METIKFVKESEGVLLTPGITTTSTFTTGDGTGMTMWGPSKLIETNIYSDHIDQIFKESYMITYNFPGGDHFPERIYKIVYSCIDNKWNVSDKIYGKIIQAQKETYEFQD